MKSSIWLVVTAGPSLDKLPTMSTGPGATGRRDPERRMVDVDCCFDGEFTPVDDGPRRTTGPVTVRRMDGAGSKPFSSMAAIASALMESPGPLVVERRMVADRRRRPPRSERPDDGARTGLGTSVAPVDAEPVKPTPVDVVEGVVKVRSESDADCRDDGVRTTGATGRSPSIARCR